MISDWKIIHSELLFQNRWMELYEDKVEVRPGKITHYTWYRTLDVAVIVPFIDKSTLVMLHGH
jgi:ADP-ribose pyrophosphatase